MGDERLFSELERLRRAVGPALCGPPAPCRIVVGTELVLHADGTRERVGTPPSPLCGGCPTREERRRPIRHIEVVRDLRNRHGDEVVSSAATLPPYGPEAEPEGHAAPQPSDVPTAPKPKPDALPSAWGPDHPARLALEGREPAPRRRRFEVPGIDPKDFGL